MKNKKLWIIILSLFLIMMLFLGRWFLNKKTNDLTNYVRNLLLENQYEVALKIFSRSPWLVKTNKNFLIVKTLCLINKKIVDANNFTIEDGIIIENNVKLLNNKKLNGQDNWELGFIYENIDKKEKALEHYQKALASIDIVNKKDKSNILSDIAHIYEALGDIQKSNEYYDKSIKEDENNLVAKWRKAIRVLDINVLEDRLLAKSFANQIVKSKEVLASPIREDMLNLLGTICWKEGEDNCKEYFENSLEINNRYPITYYKLIEYYLSKAIDNDIFCVTNKTILTGKDIELISNFVSESMAINNSQAMNFIYLSVLDELMDNSEVIEDDLYKALMMVDKDNFLWGEAKNRIKAIIYFKLALFSDKEEAIKTNLGLAIKNDDKIKGEILDLVQKNLENDKIQILGRVLDK